VVTLQQLDPMFVDYYVPQQDLSQIKVGQKVTVTADGFGDRNFAGTVTALDARVDPNSRMLHVRATVPNADGALLPNMYVNVATDAGPTQQLVTVPQAAVAYNPYGSLVYILTTGKDDQGHDQTTAHQQFVTTGIARGDQVSILKGVKAGDVVVTAGQLKLHNGSTVKIDNSVQPLDNPAPVVRDQ
jgi:membrane fusion protein (multidrug efflux system)